MDFVKQIQEKTVSISEFNRGLAGRIFDDVKENGSKVVLKNNVPECVLVSVDEYSKLMEEIQDARDLLLANERFGALKKEDLVSQETFEKTFKVDLNEVSPLDDDEIG